MSVFRGLVYLAAGAVGALLYMVAVVEGCALLHVGLSPNGYISWLTGRVVGDGAVVGFMFLPVVLLFAGYIGKQAEA